LDLNRKYQVDKGAPNFIAFGSNLAEEVLAFDKRQGKGSAVYMLTWHSPNEEYALKVAETFRQLAEAIKRAINAPETSTGQSGRGE
jgi:hypothetical protein